MWRFYSGEDDTLIDSTWKRFSNHSIRFTKRESDEPRAVFWIGVKRILCNSLSPSLSFLLPNTDNYFNVYFFPVSLTTVKWAANRNATKSQKSNSKMLPRLFQFTIFYCFTHKMRSFFFFFFVIRATINLIFESSSNENATNEKNVVVIIRVASIVSCCLSSVELPFFSFSF